MSFHANLIYNMFDIDRNTNCLMAYSIKTNAITYFYSPMRTFAHLFIINIRELLTKVVQRFFYLHYKIKNFPFLIIYLKIPSHKVE